MFRLHCGHPQQNQFIKPEAITDFVQVDWSWGKCLGAQETRGQQALQLDAVDAGRPQDWCLVRAMQGLPESPKSLRYGEELVTKGLAHREDH